VDFVHLGAIENFLELGRELTLVIEKEGEITSETCVALICCSNRKALLRSERRD
jgi:hypothetical protein